MSNATRLRKYYAKNKMRLQLKAKALYRRDPRYKIWERARWRAKRDGMCFSLCPDDIIVPKNCPILGIVLRIADGKPNDHSPSLDRKNNRRGYVRDNVCIISYRANRIKNDATLKELRAVLKYMER
jgi:hypothetical protein